MTISKNKMLLCKIIILWMLNSFLFAKFSYSAGILITIFSLVVFFTCNMEEKYIFILSSIPMAAIMRISENLPSSIVILYISYIFLYINKTKKIDKNVFISIIVFFFLQLIDCLVFNAGIFAIISFIVNIIFFYVSYKVLSNVEDKESCFILATAVYSSSVFIDIIFSQIFPDMAYAIAYEKQAMLEMAGRFAALNGDPNYYNQFVCIAMCLIYAVVMNKNLKGFYNAFSILFIIFLFFSGIDSGSKSFILTVLLLIINALYIYKKRNKLSKSFVIKIVALSIISSGAVIFLWVKFGLPLFEMRSLDNTTLLSNREVIWINYVTGFVSNPFIWFTGAGITNGGNLIANGAAAHNVYMEIITETGILGLFMLNNIFKPIIVKSKNIFNDYRLLFLTALIITSLGLSLSSNDLVFVVLPIIALIENSKMQIEK